MDKQGAQHLKLLDLKRHISLLYTIEIKKIKYISFGDFRGHNF